MIAQIQRQRTSKGRRAFTMIELLVVIMIIAVLAALVSQVASGAARQSKRKKAQGQIQALQEGLEQYKLEYGNYPRPVGGSLDPIDQAKMLYQALSGDGTNMIDGVQPTASTGEVGKDGKVILDALFAGSKKSSFVHEDFYVMDPWRQPYNYVRGDENNQTFNKTTFDIWTEATPRPDQEEDEDTWISNWQ